MTVAYDGTDYYGWQKQNDPRLVTAEGELEKSLRKLFKDNTLTMMGASRTDKGVHSLGQRITIDVNSNIPAENIPNAVRQYLPWDMAVTAAVDVPFSFHPRYDCIKKTYQYKIWNKKHKNPMVRNYSEYVSVKLDIMKMEIAAKECIGTYDFKAFCAMGSSVVSTVRTIFDCKVKASDDFVVIEVTGDGFLYNMVRIIVGTLISVGKGKIEPMAIQGIIAGGDRQLAGPTAGPQGLTLLNIYY